MGQQILKKLTIRDLIGSKAAILKVAMMGTWEVDKENEATGKIEKAPCPIGKPVDLAVFVGHVTGIKPGESDFGPFCELRGSFKATNLQTGEIVLNVAKCILPNFVGDLIAEAVKGGNGNPVDFAVKIMVRYVETAATMYEFRAETLFEAKQADSVAAIEALLAGQGIVIPTKAAPLLLTADDKKAAPVTDIKGAGKKEQAKGDKKAA